MQRGFCVPARGSNVEYFRWICIIRGRWRRGFGLLGAAFRWTCIRGLWKTQQRLCTYQGTMEGTAAQAVDSGSSSTGISQVSMVRGGHGLLWGGGVLVTNSLSLGGEPQVMDGHFLG